MGGKRKFQQLVQQPSPTKEWRDEDFAIVPADDANEYVMSDDVYSKWARLNDGKGHVIDGGGEGGDKGGDKGGGKGDGDGDGDEDGKGGGKGNGGKGNGGKGKLRKGNYEPKPGDVLYFHPSRRHAFYDDFPRGNLVDADFCSIDLEKSITVLHTRSAKIDSQHSYHGRRTMKYVSVSFLSDGGYTVWTNFSRKGVVWLRFS